MVLPTITVEADRFELRVDEELAVWQGSVVARQGGHVFRTSTLTMKLDDLDAGSSDAAGSKADSAEADLPADYELSAESLSYDVASNVVAGDGDCMLRRGEEYLAADRIRFLVNERIAYALPGEQGRVRVHFYGSPSATLFPSVLQRPLAAAE